MPGDEYFEFEKKTITQDSLPNPVSPISVEFSDKPESERPLNYKNFGYMQACATFGQIMARMDILDVENEEDAFVDMLVYLLPWHLTEIDNVENYVLGYVRDEFDVSWSRGEDLIKDAFYYMKDDNE